MKLIWVINGWKETPHCWRHFLVPPLRIRREPVLIKQDGKLALREAPAVYSVQVLGFVVFVEIGRGMPA